MHYFLIDFCYFTCVACMIAVMIFVAKPQSVDMYQTVFQTVFAMANGPVLGALIVWRNSLVFHSIDKITTVYIHCLPSLLMWCWRWYGLSPINNAMDLFTPGLRQVEGVQFTSVTGAGKVDASSSVHDMPEMGMWNWIGLPLIAYIIWQGLYLLKTEYWDREKLDSNPSLQTSLRWIAHNEKMASHRISLKIMRKLGLMKPDEKFDPSSLKTKLVMVTGQLIFTLVTLLPVKPMYDSFWLHSLVMMYAYVNCVWNGASYYIEVFSEAYAKQFEALSKVE